jgi:hypothetical protein
LGTAGKYFSSCDFLRKVGSMSVSLPSVHALAVTDSFRCNDFYSHATNMCISENPFIVEVIGVLKNDGTAV